MLFLERERSMGNVHYTCRRDFYCSSISHFVLLFRRSRNLYCKYETTLDFIWPGIYNVEIFILQNNAVRNELYEIKWFEQSLRYQRVMQTFMCLTQRDIVIKAGVKHIASYALFASVLRLSYSFFNILYTSV